MIAKMPFKRLYNLFFLGNYSDYMLTGKTIKVVRAGSFKYWAQGHTLRSLLAVTWDSH